MSDKVLNTGMEGITVTINVKRLQKFWIRKEIIKEYPFGKSIYEKISSEMQFTLFSTDKKNNYDGLDLHIYNCEKTIYKGMELFYTLLFNGFSIKPFEQVKTKKEKELKNKYDLIDFEDKENKIKAGIVLAKAISKRFFKINPHLLNRHEIIANFFSDYLNEKTKLIDLKNEVEIHDELFEEFQTEMQTLKNKLKRNCLKNEGLELYKEVIAEIAKIELIGHKPNLQRICNDIGAKKNLKTDLRKSFGQWKKRNTDTYNKLLETAKAEKKSIASTEQPQ